MEEGSTIRIQTPSTSISSQIRPSSTKCIRRPVKSSDDNSIQFTYFNKSRPKKTRAPSGFSPSYVGFKPPDLKSTADLTHFRNVMVSHGATTKAISILTNLERMIDFIPTDRYEDGDPATKYEIIQQLIEAYNFSWNECALQIKEYNEEHAIVISKLKSFYTFLLDQYPKIFVQYESQVNDLQKQCREKDRHIEVLKQELQRKDEKQKVIQEYIITLLDETERIKDRKKYYKEELNKKMLEIESLKSTVTDLRCQVAKEKEKYFSALNLNDMERELVESKPILVKQKEDIILTECGTDPIAQPENVTYTIPNAITSKFLTRSWTRFDNSSSEFTPGIDVSDPHVALRHLIFSFMITECEKKDMKLKIDQNIDLKKFYWIFPKVCSVFVSGLQFEDTRNPFTNFEDMVTEFISHHYKTSYLTQKIMVSFIYSAQLLEETNMAIKIFNCFFRSDYDFNQFRFFHTVLEYAVCYAEPELSSLVSNESLSQEDAIVYIPRDKAQYVFHAIFPANDYPVDFDDSRTTPVLFFDFLNLCILEFDKARNHFRSVLKNALLLSECSDMTHIQLRTFYSFMGLVFPYIKYTEIKAIFTDLLHQKTDYLSETIDFETIIRFAASRDNFIESVTLTTTVPNFSSIYFEYNASTLEVLDFIVKRLTYYLPSMASQLDHEQYDFQGICQQIRASLFVCDLSAAMSHYRLLLHKIDGIECNNFSTIRISNQLSAEGVANLLDHFQTREKVTGITAIPSAKGIK